jgi:hypothetical protein
VAQWSVTVNSAGRFTSSLDAVSPFTEDGPDLSPGRYQARVRFFPCSPMMGQICEGPLFDLRGPLVEKRPIVGKIAEKKIWFTVP